MGMFEKKNKANSLTEAEVTEMLNSIESNDMKALAKLIVEIKNENEREAEYAKRQSIFSLCTAVFCLVLVVVILVWGAKFVPTVEKLATEATELVENTNNLISDTNDIVLEANGVLVQATDMISETAVVVNNLENITTDLAELDIQGVMDDVDSLVLTSEASMQEAAQKIEDIDIKSLNKAIADLQSVVAPLAKLFKK